MPRVDLGSKFGVVDPELLVEGSGVQQVAHPLHQFGAVDGLGEEVVGAGVEHPFSSVRSWCRTSGPDLICEARTIERHGRVTRALHWLTAVALGAQFTIGYVMETGGSGRGRGRGRGGESGRGRGRGGDLEVFGDDGLLTTHVALGMSILLLAVVRMWWRRRSTLPPWAPQLSSTGRLVEHKVEVVFYVLLLLIPATGLWLVFVDDDAVILHVGAHVAFFVGLAIHVGLVVKNRLLRRML